MQRSYLLLIFTIWQLPLFAQVVETFSDSNFSSNPGWLGEPDFFTVSSEFVLQSNGPNASAQLYLSTDNTRCRDTEWNFYAKLDFDITTSNWAKVYLTTDRSNTKANPKGYYVKFDGSSNSIDLYKQDSTVHTKLISGKPGRTGKTSLNIFYIKVICDPEGNWYLYSDTTATGNAFEKEGTARDTSFSTSAYCGVYFAHSATRRNLFYFDNLTILPAPLSLLSVKTVNDQLLELTFNRTLEATAATVVSNYSLLPSNVTIQSATLHNLYKNKVLISLSGKMRRNIQYTISVTGITDQLANPIGFLSSVSFFYTRTTHYGDLVITELFSDPEPSIKLPDYEYVEILNRTNDTLDLQGFGFSDGTTTALFPSLLIAPHHYWLLCASGFVQEFSAYAPVLGLSNFPSLNNSGDKLELKNQYGEILHQVAYSDLWYGDNDKKQGGWSLEMIDTANPCGDRDNWTASIDATGGTPTKVNSVAASRPDLTAPQLISAFIIDNNHILISFDEKIASQELSVSTFSLDKNSSIDKISFPNPQQILLEISTSFIPGVMYALSFSGIKDCNGNGQYTPVTISCAMPQDAKTGDVLINEILFNPLPGGYDFVELYNCSEKYIDLRNWQLANTKETTISNKEVIATDPLILSPHEYFAFTENKSILLNHYPKGKGEKIVQAQSLPSYNDDEGSVVLLNAHGQEQDRFEYSEAFHFPLIDNKEGVSLERISPNEPTQNSSNWHSASTQHDYATPGYKNSENRENSEGTEVWIEPKIFTPDQNGDKDYALIHYRFESIGNVANITIFDPSGREILRLARNELLATEGFYKWDGNNSEQERVRSGPYVVYLEVFNLNGEMKKYKEVVIVGWKPD